MTAAEAETSRDKAWRRHLDLASDDGYRFHACEILTSWHFISAAHGFRNCIWAEAEASTVLIFFPSLDIFSRTDALTWSYARIIMNEI